MGLINEKKQVLLDGGGSAKTNTNTGNTNTTTGTNAPTSTPFSYKDFTYDAYKESDLVNQAKLALDAQLAQKPGAYQSQWQSQLNDVMDKIMNREKFSYDLNGDALYQQYKDKYIQQGKMAMADTMGQAAAMTGGYGNSYAAAVGNQAYQASLQNLNDIVPELYQMAYDRYNQEEQSLYNQYGLITDRENTDYGRYRDTVSDFNTERDYLANRYDSERSFDYSKYTDQRNFAYQDYSDDRNLAYTDHRNTITDSQWQKEFDEAMRQYNTSLAEQQRQYNTTMDYNKAQAAAKANTGGGNTSYNNGGDDDNEFHKATYSRDDEYGNKVYYVNGKEQKFAPGINPYTGGKNADIKYGTFSNGYQPNNVNGQKLSKSGITDVVNGVTQNVWKTPDGTKWIWDGTKNKYLKYED